MQLTLPWRRGQAQLYGSIPRINWSHPLAYGLGSYVINIGPIYIDLVSGQPVVRQSGSTHPGIGSSPFGSGIQFGAVGTDDWFNSTTSPFLSSFTASPFTQAIGVFFKTYPASGTIMASLWSQSTSPFNVFVFQANSQTSFNVLYATGSGGAGYASTAGGCSVNAFHSCMAVATGSSAGSIYVNGVLDGTVSGSPTTQTGAAGTQLVLNSLSTGGNSQGGLGGFLYYWAGWNRPLTAIEARLLHDDPYCFLVYPEDEIFATLVGAAAAADVLMAQIWL